MEIKGTNGGKAPRLLKIGTPSDNNLEKAICWISVTNVSSYQEFAILLTLENAQKVRDELIQRIHDYVENQLPREHQRLVEAANAAAADLEAFETANPEVR